MNSSDNPIQMLSKVKRKMQMVSLLYEFNRLQFAVLTYVEANEQDPADPLTMNKAIDIITPLFHSCIVNAKQYLSLDELNTLFGFAVMCLFEAYEDAAVLKKLKKTKDDFKK